MFNMENIYFLFRLIKHTLNEKLLLLLLLYYKIKITENYYYIAK